MACVTGVRALQKFEVYCSVDVLLCRLSNVRRSISAATVVEPSCHRINDAGAYHSRAKSLHT